MVLAALPIEGRPAAHSFFQRNQVQSAAKKIGPATRTIAGRVFDAHGRPLAEASVWLIRQDDSRSRFPVLTVIAEARSRTDGRFDLAPLIVDLRKHAEDPTAEFEVWIWKSGFAVGHRSYYGELLDEPINILLAGDSAFELVLKTPKGAPCQGAAVTPAYTQFDYPRVIPKPLRDRLKVNSAVDGHVVIHGFNGRLKGVLIEKPEFGAQTLVLSEQASSPLVTTLHNTRTIEGRFIFPPRERVDPTQAIVRLEVSTAKMFPCKKRAKDDVDPGLYGFWQEFAPKVDRDGRFHVSGVLDHGAGQFHVHGFPDAPLLFAPPTVAESPEPDPSNGIIKADIPLMRGIWCDVLVRDARTKKPLAGVDIAIGPKRVVDGQADCDEAVVLPDSDHTDDQGRIRLRVRPGETYRFRWHTTRATSTGRQTHTRCISRPVLIASSCRPSN